MNSKEYWQRREDENTKHYIKQEEEYDRQIKKIYDTMLDSMQKEIDGFYGRYAGREGITIAEAKKRVSKLDIAEYERKAKRYVEDASRDRKENGGKTNYNGYYFSDKANKEMRLYNLTMKVNRLEMLKANIGLEMIKGHAELEAFMGEILQGRTEEELKRQAGILGNTIKDNAKLAHAIPNASFHNATFSDRIWMYHDIMKADLSKLLQTGLIQGKNPRQLAKELRKYYHGDERLKNGGSGAVYNTERLMRTELARVQTEAQRQSFIENGFTQYMFITNSGCCADCQANNGKVFDVAKMTPGDNAPPLHPQCRCSVAAHRSREEFDAMMDYIDQGGSTEEWNAHGKAEWEKQKSGGKSVVKSENGDIIEVDKTDKPTQHSLQYKQFDTGAAVNEFFYYDGEERGIKAKQNSQYRQWKESLSKEQINVLENYTGDGYDDINKYWRRSGDWKNIDENKVLYQTEKLDESISAFALKDNIRVYRGIDLDTIVSMYPDAGELQDLIGHIYSDESFASTSPVSYIARRFAEQNGQDGIILELDIPRGIGRGAYLDDVSAYKETIVGKELAEYEFLIKRNAKFEIYDVDVSDVIPVLKGRWVE